MKSFIITVIIAVALVLGSLINNRQLESLSVELERINAEAAAALSDADFDRAQAEIDRLDAALTRCEPFCAAVGNHENIDRIEQNLAELRAYATGEHQSDALAKSRVLTFLFEHLPKNSRLKIENIL